MKVKVTWKNADGEWTWRFDNIHCITCAIQQLILDLKLDEQQIIKAEVIQ
jgi:hypothetical protein